MFATQQLAVTYSEAAERLAVSKSTVGRLVTAGRLRSIRVAGAPRIHVDDLADFADGLRTEGDTA